MDDKEIQRVLSGETSIDPKDIPQVTVSTPDGKSTSIDDYDSFMQFLMTASMNAQLVKIRKYFDDRRPNGLIQRFNPLVTDQPTEIKVDYAAQSFSLHNDGPDPVNVWVNSRLRPEATVNNGETINVHYETHVIKHFYLQCAPTQTAAVRIVAKD